MKNYNVAAILKMLNSLSFAEVKGNNVTIDLSKGQPGIHMLGKLDFLAKAGLTVSYKSTIDDPATAYHKRLISK